jgi:ubiquitin-protein ligase
MSTEFSEYIKEMNLILDNTLINRNIQLIKFNDNLTDIIFHFDVNSVPIKVTTDFNKYCIAESPIDILDIHKFNMTIIFKNKSPKIILEEISKIINVENININKFNDPFHVYQKLDEYSKVNIDYNELEKSFAKNIEPFKKNIDNWEKSKIPQNLLLSSSQIYQLLINEIKKVNRNKDYDHCILPEQSNPYNLIIRIKFNTKTEISKIFKQIEKDYGYDYMEIKMIIDPKAHPFIPPKLEYIKPKLKLPLLVSLINLDILKLENWSSIITLEYFITNLATQLELIAHEYIILDKNISFNELEYELIKLASITKVSTIDKVDIKIPVPKKCFTTSNKYWKSGTGYGSDEINEWDIKSYIKEQEIQNNELTNILININKLVTDDNIEMICDSILIKYIINQIKSFSLLEYAKSKDLYKEIFNILANLIGKQLLPNLINDIGSGLKPTFDELEVLFKSSSDALCDEILLHIYCTTDWYVGKYNKQLLTNQEITNTNQEIIISSDIKDSYYETMKKIQFGNYDIDSSHRFYKYKNQKLNQTGIMRVLSEISSFKKDLPLNWESSIWVRISKSNLNLFSFMISGPKDTPYENGLFEFHAYFPNDYPNTVPQVLLHTTGNGRVRFNPNLYDSGKVCLSILGTWSGQEGESWNPKTSTFLQVIVSIQSLILVEQPYFNEPGWEREMHTQKGKKASTIYSEERMPSTIKFAMTNMIKNPPLGFEDVVHNHFKLKKDEIINNTLIWEQNATQHKELINSNRNKLIELLDTL